MKIRSGFVSNSSSSSFIVVFPEDVNEKNVIEYFNISSLLPEVKRESYIDCKGMSDQEIETELRDLFIKLSNFSKTSLLKDVCQYEHTDGDVKYILEYLRSNLKELLVDLKKEQKRTTYTLDDVESINNWLCGLLAELKKQTQELKYYILRGEDLEHKYKYSFGNESEYFDYEELESTLSDFQKDVITCLEMNGWEAQLFCNYIDKARLGLH